MACCSRIIPSHTGLCRVSLKLSSRRASSSSFSSFTLLLHYLTIGHAASVPSTVSLPSSSYIHSGLARLIRIANFYQHVKSTSQRYFYVKQQVPGSRQVSHQPSCLADLVSGNRTRWQRALRRRSSRKGKAALLSGTIRPPLLPLEPLRTVQVPPPMADTARSMTFP